MQKLSFFLVIFSLFFSMSSCVSLFAPNHQKVNFQTQTPDTKIIKDGTTLEKGTVVAKLDKRKQGEIIHFKKEGFKSKSQLVYINKWSLSALWLLGDFIPLIMPILSGNNLEEKAIWVTSGLYSGIPLLVDLNSPKSRKFENMYVIPALTPYPKREENERYILINKTAVDIKNADLEIVLYKTPSQFHKKSRTKITKFDDEDLKVTNTIFTDDLNLLLKKQGFMDTTRAIFTNFDNTLYINATVKKAKEERCVFSNMFGKPSFSALNMELSIEWEVLNYYKQKIGSIQTTEKSDFFYNSEAKEAISDAFEYSFLNFINS